MTFHRMDFQQKKSLHTEIQTGKISRKMGGNCLLGQLLPSGRVFRIIGTCALCTSWLCVYVLVECVYLETFNVCLCNVVQEL